MSDFECCHHCVGKRSIDCHSWCGDYKDAKKKHNAKKTPEDIYTGYVCDKWAKIHHNENRKTK